MVQNIPGPISELFDFLKNEVTWLHARWLIFEQLYNRSPLRIELLNESAASFFYWLQLMMLDDIQLALARLTDPAPGRASLLQLQGRLESHGDHALASRAKDVLRKLQTRVEPIRIRRNEMIAHYSLKHVENKSASQVPDVEYKDLSECLDLVREYMNLIAKHYHGVPDGYEHVVLEADGETLVTMLKWALRHRDYLLNQAIYIEPSDKWSAA